LATHTDDVLIASRFPELEGVSSVTEPTYNQQQASQVDSSVQVAKISRTTAILVAVITAVATFITAYFTGRHQGEQSAAPTTATETVTDTVTKTVSAAAAGSGDEGSTNSSSTAAPGEVHLADKTPVETDGGSITVGKATVRNKEYSRTITTGGCVDGDSFAYNIDSGMQSFHTNVGLTDDSSSVSVNFAVLVDGKSRGGGVSVTVGEIAEMNVDISGGFRLTVQIETPGTFADDECGVTAVLIDPVLRP